MDAVTDRVIRDAGTPDAVWLPWLDRLNVPRVTLHDLCADTCRLVVVAPHPDDELLACGGLLAAALQHGRPALVIAVTNGEASHGTDDTHACARLGVLRAEESLAGLRRLGVARSSVVRLGMADGKVTQNLPAVAASLTRLLQKNDVVVTTWRLDGHPDHEATSQAVAQACAATGSRLVQAPVWMWHWGEPGDVRIPWANMVAFDIPPDVAILKQNALLEHQSQFFDRPGKGPVLVPSLVERVKRAHEYFFV